MRDVLTSGEVTDVKICDPLALGLEVT